MKVDGVTYITHEGVEEIKGVLVGNYPPGEGVLPRKLPWVMPGSGSLAEMLHTMQTTIETLRSELDVKNKQIETLSKILDSNYQQVLPDKKQGFWAKLLKRN